MNLFYLICCIYNLKNLNERIDNFLCYIYIKARINWNLLTILIHIYLIANTGLKSFGKAELTKLIPFFVIYMILSIYLIFYYFFSKSLFKYTISDCTADHN